jgi:hypothetical protein
MTTMTLSTVRHPRQLSIKTKHHDDVGKVVCKAVPGSRRAPMKPRSTLPRRTSGKARRFAVFFVQILSVIIGKGEKLFLPVTLYLTNVATNQMSLLG